MYECARAFTGWTTGGDLNSLVCHPIAFSFRYGAADHDRGKKSFIGHQGRFDGEDVIDIVVQQPASHIFIARHLYNFFVADEPQVPAWSIEPPRDPEAVRSIVETLVIWKSDRCFGHYSTPTSLRRGRTKGSRVRRRS